MAGFDKKIFNAEVFGKYVDTVPRVKQDQFLKAGVLVERNDLASMLAEQTGGNYITVPMYGRVGGAAQNYDGATTITADSMDTYSQSMIVVGRSKAWKELDFSTDITGENFLDVVGAQVAEFWDDIDQATIISTLKGIFGVTAFKNAHTTDISAKATDNVVGATTLNNAMQKATGANKAIFKVVICHSVVATNLENLNLIDYLKYTDDEGIQKDIGIGTWNGRLVLVDDDCPVEEVAESSSGKKDGYTKYTTYVLGDGAFTYVNPGAKVPNEMTRDALTNGGQDYLITRQRKVFAPFGFSFTKSSMASKSPTNAELEKAANWELVKNEAGDKTIDLKAIPIAQIVSRG